MRVCMRVCVRCGFRPRFRRRTVKVRLVVGRCILDAAGCCMSIDGRGPLDPSVLAGSCSWRCFRGSSTPPLVPLERSIRRRASIFDRYRRYFPGLAISLRLWRIGLLLWRGIPRPGASGGRFRAKPEGARAKPAAEFAKPGSLLPKPEIRAGIFLIFMHGAEADVRAAAGNGLLEVVGNSGRGCWRLGPRGAAGEGVVGSRGGGGRLGDGGKGGCPGNQGLFCLWQSRMTVGG